MSRIRAWLRSFQRSFTAHERLAALLEVVAQRQAELVEGSANAQNIAQRQNVLLAQIVDAQTAQHQQVMRALARIEDLQRRQALALEELAGSATDVGARDLFAEAIGAEGAADDDAVRNRPWRIMPGRLGVDHPGFAAIEALGDGAWVGEADWRGALTDAEAEALDDPDTEGLLAEIDARGGARRRRLDEGLFLYWLIRTIAPAVVVQAGDNDIASALVVLALARNGGGGRLHLAASPRPPDPGDRARGERPGDVATISETRAPGRLIPDAYRGLCTVHLGEPRDMLGKLVEGLDDIDLFIHGDPDGDEDELPRELATVYPKLARRWTIAARGVAKSGALWEFADERGVAGYNFAGALGVVFR